MRTGALRKQLLALRQIASSPSSSAGAARAFSAQVNYLPYDRSVMPRHVRLSGDERMAILDEFPAMELREAFRRCKVGALPVQTGTVARRRESIYAAEIRYARKHATGDVKLLLNAIEAASPAEDEDAVRRELTKKWREQGSPLTAETVVGVLRAARSARVCLHFFNWAAAQQGFQHSTVTYNGLVQTLVKHDFFQQALRLYGIMQGRTFRKAGCGADTVTLGILVRRLLSSAKGFEHAIELLNEATASGIDVSDELIHDVICFLCKLKKMLPLSLRYFHRMKKPGDKTYHVLVRTMCKEQFVDEAYDLIVSMAVEAGCPTDDVTYHMLIAEFCKRGELSKAHVLLHDCMDRGRAPSVLTYNSVLELLSKKGDRDGADKAWNLLQSMVSSNVAPNVVTYTTVIQGLAKGGRLDDAMVLLEEMLGRECVPDSAAGKALVAGLVRTERVAEALRVVLRMNQLRQPLDFESSSSVVYGFLRAGRIQDALDAVTKLEGRSFSPDLPMCNVFIGVLSHKGRFPLALRFYRELLKRGLTPDAATFAPMIIGYCDQDRVPEAYGLFKEMLLQKNCSPNLSIYKAIIGAFCKKGDMDEACQLLEQMFNKDCYPDAALYKVVIKGLRKSWNSQACDILENAVKQQSGDAPDEAMFKAVYKLRSCIRPPSRRKANAADSVQVAEVVEVIPAKLRFSDSSESESDSESE